MTMYPVPSHPRPTFGTTPIDSRRAVLVASGTKPTSATAAKLPLDAAQPDPGNLHPSALDRRTALILTSSLVTSFIHSLPASALSTATPQPSSTSRGLARYIRRKQLDPLDTYVPVLLDARQQLVVAGDVMQRDLVLARDLLRSGPFAGLRDNVRALGEYAVINGQETESAPLVNGFFRALEGYDRVLFVANKEKKELDQQDAQTRLEDAIAALDKLLATVPEDIMSKSESIVAATRAKLESGIVASDNADASTDKALELLLK